jgi:FkbM family methyltransferase
MEKIKLKNNLSELHSFQIGLSSQSGYLDLYLGITNSGQSAFTKDTNLSMKPLKTKVIPFDQWRKKTGLELPSKPEWVAKIDVEGHEIEVLKGMKESICSRAFKGISIEIMDYNLKRAGHSPQDIFNFMNNCGYQQIEEKELKIKYGNIKHGNNPNVYFILKCDEYK